VNVLITLGFAPGEGKGGDHPLDTNTGQVALPAPGGSGGRLKERTSDGAEGYGYLSLGTDAAGDGKDRVATRGRGNRAAQPT
jgi:hypothetical protein